MCACHSVWEIHVIITHDAIGHLTIQGSSWPQPPTPPLVIQFSYLANLESEAKPQSPWKCSNLKLVQLGPHCLYSTLALPPPPVCLNCLTWTSLCKDQHWTCSNLFTKKHGLSASGWLVLN